MNSCACFIFLLAIGLSAQKSEFEIDFDIMVKTVKLGKDRTLWNCPETCNEINEAECKCRNFTCLVGTDLVKCIQDGLGKLNFSDTEHVIARLESLGLTEDKNLLTNQKLSQKMSPKSFLEYIKELHERSNV